MRPGLLCLWIAWGLLGCQPVPASTVLASVTPPISTPVPASSPTEIQLPFDPNVRSDKYCQPPSAILPVSDGDDISEEEIVHQLVKLWLRRYASPDAPLFCRIDGYQINRIYYDVDVISKPLAPRGDFMRVVQFSVKLIQFPNAWLSFAGELDSDHWLHIQHVVAISKTVGGYTMEFAYP